MSHIEKPIHGGEWVLRGSLSLSDVRVDIWMGSSWLQVENIPARLKRVISQNVILLHFSDVFN